MISVIIPTYNSSQTIKRAITSVLNQTYNDFEIILVDDGSIDNTKEIVSEIDDYRINYFYKENGGIADARNFGVSKANGDYISFLDSDDYYDNDYLENMINSIGDCEVCVCDFRYVFEDGTAKDMHCPQFRESNLFNNKRLLIDIMPQPWNKLIKRDVFDRTDLEFPKGLVFEDLCFFSSVMPEIKSITKINKPLINYYQLNSSIMSSARQIKKTIYDFDKIVEIINTNHKKNYGNTYNYELEGLFALNARELIDGIVNNETSLLKDKIDAVKSVLNTINKEFNRWYKNEYYTEKYKSFGSIYLFKRRIIDYLLSKNKVEFVMKYILCRGEK